MKIKHKFKVCLEIFLPMSEFGVLFYNMHLQQFHHWIFLSLFFVDTSVILKIILSIYIKILLILVIHFIWYFKPCYWNNKFAGMDFEQNDSCPLIVTLITASETLVLIVCLMFYQIKILYSKFQFKLELFFGLRNLEYLWEIKI